MPVNLISTVGKLKGRFQSKENRAAKLLAEWPELTRKMEAMVVRGLGRTDVSRMAYGILVTMETGIRIGNEGSAEGWICDNQITCKKDNPEKGLKVGDVIWRHPMYGQHVQTFGLTTLLNKHVKKRKNSVALDFTGKKLVDQTLILKNPVLVDYMPMGPADQPWLGVTYRELFKFVKKYVGRKFMPKDLRTAVVNLDFSKRFCNKHAKDFAQATTKGARKAVVKQCIEETAASIGHTPGVCKSAYLSKEMMAELLNSEVGTEFVMTQAQRKAYGC